MVWLLLILKRYEFSSKSQQPVEPAPTDSSCCWYYKGTNFQANHNQAQLQNAMSKLLLILQRYEFSSKSQPPAMDFPEYEVVADTTKVRIFKQITTNLDGSCSRGWLLLILQRYEFSSKSQQFPSSSTFSISCCWYYKGTNFQANHN